jgi:hypothetical protein
MKTHNDPKHYEEMSKPFANGKLANEAINGFLDEVSRARDKFGLADVHVIVMVSIMKGKKKSHGISYAHFGYELNAAQMCEWGLSKAMSKQREVILKLADEVDEQP